MVRGAEGCGLRYQTLEWDSKEPREEVIQSGCQGTFRHLRLWEPQGKILMVDVKGPGRTAGLVNFFSQMHSDNYLSLQATWPGIQLLTATQLYLQPQAPGGPMPGWPLVHWIRHGASNASIKSQGH